MNLIERHIDSEYLYKGKILNMKRDTVLLPNGKIVMREVVEHNGAVCILPITEENEVIFVNQYRYPYGKVLLELPAGKLEKGEDPLEAGKRELQEETGVIASEYISLGEFYPAPGYSNEIIHLYLAKGLTFAEQNLDEDEFLTVEKMPLEQAEIMIAENKITDGKTIAAILKAKLLLK